MRHWASCRPGDTLVVWRLDWLGRSLRHLIDTVFLLQKRGIGFKSLQEQIDTTTSGGKLVFHVFGALAEFERDLIRERTQAGLLAARARGRLGGHPRAPALNTPRKMQIAQQLYNDKTNSIADVCRTLRISRPPCTGTSRQGKESRPDTGRVSSSPGSS
jgi:DNA invertase Pin-like site-specific DNA recombinase